MSSARTVAVALHDVEERTFEDCRRIRAWLHERGIDRVTLLVIPAPAGKPLDPDGELATWLRHRLSEGDAAAQHGFRHEQRQVAGAARQWLARLQGAGAAEFVGLDRTAARRALVSGRATLNAADIHCRGFVAPAFAYTSVLRRELPRTFDWWAGLVCVHRRPAGHSYPGSRRRTVTPAHCFGTSTALKRLASPVQVRMSARVGGRLLRLDVHPADFEHPRHVAALESALHGAQARRPMTYDDLVAT